MASFVVGSDLYDRVREDLTDPSEVVGFFLSEYEPKTRTFRLGEWRVIPPDGYESRSGFHLVLRDEVRAEVIKWAWDEGASLVEAHSHSFGEAELSWSDLAGLSEWIPHLWWRLRGRPYGAMVIDSGTIDALAWIDDAQTPEQVEALKVGTERTIRATGRTLSAPRGARRGIR